MKPIYCASNEEEAAEPVRYAAIFRLGKKDYPELKRATIVITDEGDKVIIGVKAVGRVFKKTDGGISVREEQFGDLCCVSKSEPVSNFFDIIKGLFGSISELINESSDVEA